MSTYTIENQWVLVQVDEQAAEIHHFQSKENGLEYMWQGNPKYWSGRNPTLFPMVGKSKSGYLTIKGKTYQMGNHGFTRNSLFHCIHHDENTITMVLEDSEDTLKQYPYHFRLVIDYILVAKKLVIHYSIENKNEEVMPFHFGLHPAFNCPLEKGKHQQDYHIELAQEELVNGVLTSKIDLDPVELRKTIILEKPSSRWSKLSDGKHFVKVFHDGYPWLAYWSPEAPFVCIEPWYSHTDFTENHLDYEEREGCIKIEPKGVWQCSYSIEID
ncbi:MULTISPECIES: aldose 1-epimerase family protein [Terrabacteria group]|uniref:aldose 1-epimerase family protein n=1 Tax=Bacillati TaxID=1783272 RepID=UPI001C6E81F8|nr:MULTISPECIES: aldose 1-epimerase family protein [Terrabacteria group]MBW9212264.1 aldose 1-epimerase family protein [Trueperella sp. zg.1013]